MGDTTTNGEEGQQPLRWGELLRMEMRAEMSALKTGLSTEIAVIKATAVTHRDFMLWGAALGLAILLAVVYLSKDQKEAIVEVQKDIRALYKSKRPEKSQARLESPPPGVPVVAP